MIRMATVAVLCAAFLSACTNLPNWEAARQFLAPATRDDNLVQYSFDWRLSGERQVAPLQVFDDGERTWLHFLPEQIIPAIFQHTSNGERLLTYVRQGEFLILDGVWPVLSFRGGGLGAMARKSHSREDVQTNAGYLSDEIDTGMPEVSAISAMDHAASVVMPLEGDLDARYPATVDLAEHQLDSRVGLSIDVTRVDSPRTDDDAVQLTDASFDALSSAPSSYGVRLQDENLRQTLHRWAARANWAFAPEHWDVGVDIPISGEADFYGSFEEAVQDLLASTELTDSPLRPCFYSNRVLRVVAYTQPCDRSGAHLS